MSDLLREAWGEGMPKCPWCGYVVRDPWELEMNDDDHIEHECPQCEKEFEIRCRIEITYTTDKIVEWEECEKCGGTGTRNLDERELKACNLEFGSVRCDCRDGKKYVTARWKHADGVMKLLGV